MLDDRTRGTFFCLRRKRFCSNDGNVVVEPDGGSVSTEKFKKRSCLLFGAVNLLDDFEIVQKPLTCKGVIEIDRDPAGGDALYPADRPLDLDEFPALRVFEIAFWKYLYHCCVAKAKPFRRLDDNDFFFTNVHALQRLIQARDNKTGADHDGERRIARPRIVNMMLL